MLTAEQRFTNYQRALNFFINDKASGAMEVSSAVCPILCGWPDRKVYDSNVNRFMDQDDYVSANFPEFVLNRPPKGNLYFALLWWNSDNFGSCIKALENCIKLIEDEILRDI